MARLLIILRHEVGKNRLNGKVNCRIDGPVGTHVFANSPALAEYRFSSEFRPNCQLRGLTGLFRVLGLRHIDSDPNFHPVLRCSISGRKHSLWDNRKGRRGVPALAAVCPHPCPCRVAVGLILDSLCH